MNRIIALAAAALVAAPSLAAPQLALAGDYDDYGRGDICAQRRDEAATRGSVLGGILGGIFGASVAGRHDRVAGAVIGGTAGAVAGHEIGKHSVRCLNYPARVGYHRNNCRWVEERRHGEDQEFEVCRDRDGVWRPSGRA
ncbi:MAG TPA: glycine zipper 2TM domain-containing protein [Caulobacteraceae bacterium]|nr:glycine zipper 2TM domain-containing protein [Caulobacteraceae bacterium]